MANLPAEPLIPALPDARARVSLNAAAVGLMSAETLRELMHQTGSLGRRGEPHVISLMAVVDDARAGLARLIGAQPADVGFTTTTSHGMDLFAQIGLRGRRRRILAPAEEFPTSCLPFEGRGYEVTLIEAVDGAWPLAAFEPHLGDDVFALVVSARQFATGTATPLAPLAKLAHAHGALMIANVTQAVGLMPLTLAADGVDFAAGTGHKWLMSGFGNGFLYAPAASREAHPLPGMGWLSVEDAFAMRNHGATRRQDAAVVEYGALPFLPRVALDVAARQLEAAGMDAVFAHAHALAEGIRDGAAARGIPIRQAADPSLRGATVSLAVEDAPTRVKALAEAGIVVSARGGVRVSPHAYNCAADIEAFWSAWDQLG